MADASIRRDELAHSSLNVFAAIQFKLWTDTTILLILFTLLAIYDLFLNTRTLWVSWIHILAFILYLISRIQTIFNFSEIQTKKVIPTVALASFIHMGLGGVLIWQAYLGRFHKELMERVAFLDVREDKNRLKELRDAQKKRKMGKAETVTEGVVHSLKKVRQLNESYRNSQAQTLLESAAFEKSAHGDVALSELNEILRHCIDILFEVDDLFAVGTGSQELGGEAEESRFINMFGRSAAKQSRAVKSGQRQTGQDLIRLTFDQQEFFTSDIMPEFRGATDLTGIAGLNPGIKMLEMYRTDPNLLVNFGQALLFPFIDALGTTAATATKYLYQIQRRYFPNPYHNAAHGAMVAHMAVVITKMLDIDTHVRPLDNASLVIAALGHDVGHPGRNNNFYITTQGLMCRMYNDISILESYHSFLAFRFAVVGSEVNIFANLQEVDYRVVRAAIIDLILITDMSQHFASIGKFRIRKGSDKFDVMKNVEDAQ